MEDKEYEILKFCIEKDYTISDDITLKIFEDQDFYDIIQTTGEGEEDFQAVTVTKIELLEILSLIINKGE